MLEKDKKASMTYFKNWLGGPTKSQKQNLAEMVKFWDEWKCRPESVDLIQNFAQSLAFYRTPILIL